MTSSLDPPRARAGDVAAAILQVDSLLARMENPDRVPPTGLRDTLVSSMVDLSDVTDGFCTLVYMFVSSLRSVHEAAGRDVVEGVLPGALLALRHMPKSVAPEAIPTMSALITAAALNLSPSLWRAQFGPWTPRELRALEATALVLAIQINRMQGDGRAAVRLVTDVLARVEADGGVG
ncbi:hypothetical protein AB0J86_18720 [Micromonospora sp. NPDC049559]|uniref:hypothetical protein n=1 Tax=Micromonospora sp. NPDC049559 TaxID=3155923 RepID=UPI00343D9B12